MPFMSKHFFDSVIKDLPCYVLIHPGNKSCLKAGLSLYKALLIGSAKFNFPLYTAEFLMQGGNRMSKEQVIKIARDFVRSIIVTTLDSALGFQLVCLLRHVTGKFSYYSFLTLPFALCGLVMYLERPRKRIWATTGYFNFTIEYGLRCLEKAGYLSITKTKQVFMFMLGSSILLYLMRLEKYKDKRRCVLWLIHPEKVRSSNEHSNICPHDGECKKHIFKHASTYFGIGLAASLVKLFVPRLKTPFKALSSIKGKHFQLALFLGSYVGIYKAVTCYLCRRNGNDSALYAIPGGYAAGLSMLFSPNLNLAIAPFIEIIKLYSTTLYEKNKLLSNLQLSVILFCFCQSMLCNARILDAETCPRYIFYLVNTITNGTVDSLYKNFWEKFADTTLKVDLENVLRYDT